MPFEEESTRLTQVLATYENDDATVRSRGIERLLADCFDGKGWGSAELSASHTFDFEFVTVSSDSGREVDVVVDSILRYGDAKYPLTQHDWDDWTLRIRDELGDRFGLLVSERQPAASLIGGLNKIRGEEIFVERIPATVFDPGGAMVLLPLQPGTSDHETLRRFQVARATLEAAVTARSRR